MTSAADVLSDGQEIAQGAPATSDRRRSLQMAAFLLLNVVLVVLAIVYFDKWDAFVAVLHKVDARIILSIAGLALTNYMLRAWRYKLLNTALGVTIPFRQTLLFYVAGFSFSVTPGKVGELVRIWMIKKAYGYPVRQTSPAVVVDRLGDLLATLALCVCTLSVFADHIVPVAAAGGLICAGVFVLTRPDWICDLLGYASRFAGSRLRLIASLRRVVRGTSKLLRWPVLISTLAVGIGAWLCESTAFFATLHFFGGQTSYAAAIFVFAFSNLIGALTFLPGGIGGTELTMITLLTALGVAPEVAIATTVLVRAMTLWFGVVLGLGTSMYVSRALRSGPLAFALR